MSGIREGQAARPRRAPAVVLVLAAALAAGSAGAGPLGVNAHVPGPELLDRIAAGGARWVRVDFLWSWVEPYPDRFDWTLYDDLVDAAEARGLRLYATIADTPAWATAGAAGRGVPRDSADWYDICHRAASRYRGRVDHWGMWNEPNDARFWAGTRAQYIDVILKPGAAAVHAASAGARACGPELAHLESGHWDTWLREVLRRAGDDLDVVTHHLYPDGTSSRSVVDMLAKSPRYPWDPPSVKRVLADSGWLGKPFWLTETGCPSGDSGSSQQSQAGFIAALSRSLLGPDRSVTWVDKVFFYEAADDPRYAPALGLLGPAPDYPAKPAYGELVRTARELPMDDAEVVRADVPEWLPAGGTAVGTVLLRNTGTTAWSAAGGYRLEAGEGDVRLPVTGMELDGAAFVRPGETVALTVGIEARSGGTAPGSPFPVAWRMSRQGRWSFGETVHAEVAIGDGGAASSFLVPVAPCRGSGAGTAPAAGLALHNRGHADLPVTVTRHDGESETAVAVTVPAGGTVLLADPRGGETAAVVPGAFRVLAPSGALLAAPLTGAAAMPAALVPSGRSAAPLPAGGERHFLRVERDPDELGVRTDLLLFNDGDAPATVGIEVRGDGGWNARSSMLEVAAGATAVVSDVMGGAGVDVARSGHVTLRPSLLSAGVHAWVLRRVAGAVTEMELPVAATDEPVVLAPLAGGARLRGGGWRSDVHLANPGVQPVRVTLALLTPAGVSVPAREVEVPAGGDVVIVDVLGALFSYRGSAALLATPSGGAVALAGGSLLSRAGAPVRRAVAPLALGAAVGTGGDCRLLPVRHAATEPGARTHLQLVNLAGVPITVRARVLDAAGAALALVEADLAAREARQVADVLAGVSGVDGDVLVLVLDTLTPGGRFAASATVVPAGGTGGALVPCLR